MARFTIEIDCDGRFFEDSQGMLDPSPAIIMILHRYIEHTLTRWRIDATLTDMHGKSVGRARLEVDAQHQPISGH
jgi:hypothetical protein